MATLVLVMSEVCGACQQFKKNMLPALKNDLENDSRFNFIIKEFPTMVIGPPKNNEYHPELRNFVRFFPTFIVFPEHLWDNPKSKLKGIVKHGSEENPKIDYSKNSLNNWINESLKNPMFSGGVVVTNSKLAGVPGNVNTGSTLKISADGKYYAPTYGTYMRIRPGNPDYEDV